MSQAKYNIAQLAELADVSRRTVRYYIQRNLLPPPFGSGRGSYYDEKHLAKLIEIRDLQLKGVPLSEILLSNDSANLEQKTTEQNRIPGSPQLSPTIPMEHWNRITICDGVELHIREQALSPEQIETIKTTIYLLAIHKESKS